MNEIVTVPNRVTQAGLDFSYAVWTQGTKITLCNVPWDANYKDVWNMEKPEDFDKYIKENGMAVTEVTSVQYVKANDPVRLNIPFNAANRFNYMKVENPLQPIQGDKRKVFYYFINDVQYIAPNTTQFNVMLDAWITWLPFVTLGQCYIERSHILMATNNPDVDSRYLDIPEGFDIGSDYKVAELGKVSANNIDDDDHYADYSKACGVIIVSTVSLDADPGDVNTPNLETSSGSTTNNIPNGAEIYYIDNITGVSWLFKALAKYPWISQGILSVTIVPLLKNAKGARVHRFEGVSMIKLDEYDKTYIKNLVPDWRTQISHWYNHDKDLLKLYTAPYTYLELTSFNGQSLILKPQYLHSAVLTADGGSRLRETFFEDSPLRIEFSMHAIPPNPRLTYYCMSYLFDEDYAHAGGISNFPLTSIVNNGYISYMASNAHGIAYQYQNADWTQQRAMAAAQLGYNQSSAAMGLTSDLTNQGINNAGQMRDLNNSVAGSRALLGGVNSVVNGAGQALGGNVAGGFLTAGMGVVNSAADYAITTDQNNQSTAIQQGLMASNATSRINNAGYNRDTNMEFANYAAQGDYANAIGQINAKVQDAKLTSPTVSGQSGGDAWGIHMFGTYWIRIRAKILTDNAQTAITSFWRRYGYATNLFYNFSRFDMNDNRNGNQRLNCMTHFTYWKLKELYLMSSECPELYRKTIRGIFEKGVTVWKDPRNIGKPNVLTDNKPNVPGWYI